MTHSIEAEQAYCLQMKRQGKSRAEIADLTGMSLHQVKRRIAGGLKAEKLDPEIRRQLSAKNISDLAGLHSGWLLQKDPSSGSGSSLYFHLGPDQEKIDFADAIRDVLREIPVLPPLPAPGIQADAKDHANWIMLADLHVGGHYGDPQLERDFERAIDELVSGMAPAEHAVLMELGDLLDANDHKGVTPASGNPCDVIRDNVLTNTQTAIRLMRWAILRLLETHQTVEVQMVKGNHDQSAYIGVMVALAAHFADEPRVFINVSDDEFRVIQWGLCALFPHHGDTLKWVALKNVWTDQFPDEWAQAKSFRLISTGHLHHEKSHDLGGCMGRQFGTLHRPNGWAKGRGLFSYGMLAGLRVHKTRGYCGEKVANITPMLKGKTQ